MKNQSRLFRQVGMLMNFLSHYVDTLFLKRKLILQVIILLTSLVYSTTAAAVTFYAYQSGDWNTALTWTTDPSGTLSITPAVPGAADNAVILNGRTVSISSNTKTVNSMQIMLGGYLDLGATSGHNFGTVTGQGVLRLSSGNFPAGNLTQFVSSTGGTVEYYNFTGSLSTGQSVYNNLLLSKTDNSATNYVMTLASDITLNGNMIINRIQGTGTMRLTIGNSTTVRNLTIFGDLTVSAAASVFVNSPGSFISHNLNLYGNLLNNGTLQFTNRTAPIIASYYTTDPTDAVVIVSFLGTKNTSVNCNGISNFYRIILNKGTDQSPELNIIADDPTHFGLYGRANVDINSNALTLINGTVRIGNNINMTFLANASGESYILPPTVQLWVDGGNIGVSNVINQLGVNGKFRITAGTATCPGTGGMHLNNTGGVIQIDGGTLTARVIRSSNSGGLQLGTYNQSGGTVILDGSFGMPGTNNFARLSWWKPENQFIMSGGTIIVRDAGVNNHGIDIRSYPENIKITGGTIVAEINDGRDFEINSTAPFWNLQLIRTSLTAANFILKDIVDGAGIDVGNQPLVVQSDLRMGVDNGSKTVSLDASIADVTVAGNFVIGAGCSFTPGTGTRTLTLNGSAGQVFDNSGTIVPGLNNFVITNTSNTSVTNNLTVLGNLTISLNCFLNDQGNSIGVAGNLINSGIHTSQANGAIILNGAVNQTIGGNGGGIFGNMVINKAVGTTSFIADQSVKGNIRLANGIMDINQFKLSLSATSNVYDALTGTTSNFSNTKMINLSGLSSDGGITKNYNTIGTFVFPIGSSGNYRPASIGISQNPANWGSVNVKLGARVHPLATSANVLKYYWKVSGNGFTGIQPNSISHSYHYINPGDINAGTLNNYIPGVYTTSGWSVINDVSQVNKIINNVLFTNVNYIDGDFTAGQPDAFGTVKVFYSRKPTGNWSDNDMWSTDPVLKWGGAACNCFPGLQDAVIIGDGLSNNHKVTITAASGAVNTGSLTINPGSTLDLGITTGHNFGVIPDQKITGAGTLQISSSTPTAVFPGGDFGNFLNSGGGTVEYYSNATTGAASFTLPVSYNASGTAVNITNYNNLNINAGSAKTIVLPNTDLIVFNNVTTNGVGLVEFNTQNANHTVVVKNNLNVNSGKLEFINTNAAALNNVFINNDVIVASGATFDVAATNVSANTLTIQGNLINNGIFNMRVGIPCNVSFTGDLNKGISGVGGTTNFNILTVNKGVDRNSVLNVTSTAFSLNAALPAALNLTNGTFRLSNPSLTIVLTTSAAFTIPPSGCLSANGGTINIGQANNNAGDLKLQGRLEILSGTVNIGQGSGSNNDIEYASSGNPEIIVSGGSLNVDGQIRRDLFNTFGSLWYTQSAGNVKVRGLSFDNTRGMIEIVNNGSQFNMSGGTINIERSGSVGFADAYLIPGISSVTGGIIQCGNSNTPAGNANFKVNASTPLGSIVVDGTTINKTVNLSVNPLVLVNDLTINGTGSIFNCNGLSVTIGKNLINNNSTNTLGIANGGFRPGTLIQSTTFIASSSASITGVAGNLTNFANLAFNNSSLFTLNSNSNLAVNNNLTLNSGTLADGGNTITVYGNIINNAIHTSSAGNGIVLAGSQNQIISGNGNGVFGNVNINNVAGVNLTDNATINGTLSLTNGVLYIDDYKLTLGNSSSVTTASSFGTTRMIALNGVISDQGVVKNTTGSLINYLIPLGVSGKYTPATFSVSAPSSGSIKVLPVNQDHPSDFDANGNELAYYWKVATTGLSGLTAATQVFKYLAGDVSGNETLYRGARFNNALFSDLGGVPGTINTTNHTITVSGSFLDGEFTAGETANFTNKHKLYSKSSGNWTANIWAEDLPTNPPCGYYPNGNPVYIQPGHNITMDIDNSFAYSVDIPNTAVLDMSDKLYSNLGFITGTGKVKLKGTPSGSYVFPGGNYDAFMADATGQSSVEFYGTIPATLPLKPGNIYKPFQNVIFSDAGIKYMSAENMKVLKDLTINNGALLNNTLQNKNIYILGNWQDNNTVSPGFAAGSGLVSFEGSTSQKVNIVNNLNEKFNDFKVNNPSGVTIIGGGNGDVQVGGLLYLTNGVLTTNNTNTFTITSASPSAAIGGSANSFVDGPLYKVINSGSYFNFPVGNAGRYGNTYISNASVTGTWGTQYFNTTAPYNVNAKLSPIDQVSTNEYWWAGGPPAGQANVQLRWDSNSGFAASSAASRTKIRAIEWNPGPGQWEYRGKVINDGGPNAGTVQSDNSITLAPGSNLHYLTIGLESLPTASITSSLTSSICNDGLSSTTVSVSLTGTPPWSLSYKVGSVTTLLTNLASSPASIIITSASPGISGAGAYTFNITNVNDAAGIPGIKDYTTTSTITVKPVPVPSLISPRTTVGTNEVVVYTAASFSGDTYNWSVTNGTIQSSSVNTVNIKWNGAVGTGILSLTETNPTYNCPVSISQSINIVNAPVPNVTGNVNACSGALERYQTPFVTGHTYTWTITGGVGAAVSGNPNMVDVTWGASSVGTVKVDENFLVTISNTLPVTINPLPAIANTINAPAICSGQNGVITVNNADGNGTDYQLRIGAVLVAGAFYHNTVAGANIILMVNPGPLSNTTYNVVATNQFTCSVQLTITPTLGVNPLPANITGTTKVCVNSTTALSDATPGGSWSSVPLSVSTVNASGVVTGVTAGSSTIKYTLPTGCAANATIIVDPLPNTGPVYHVQN